MSFQVVHMGPHKGILTIREEATFEGALKAAKRAAYIPKYEELQLLVVEDVQGTDQLNVLAMQAYDGSWIVDEKYLQAFGDTKDE